MNFNECVIVLIIINQQHNIIHSTLAFIMKRVRNLTEKFVNNVSKKLLFFVMGDASARYTKYITLKPPLISPVSSIVRVDRTRLKNNR